MIHGGCCIIACSAPHLLSSVGRRTSSSCPDHDIIHNDIKAKFAFAILSNCCCDQLTGTADEVQLFYFYSA